MVLNFAFISFCANVAKKEIMLMGIFNRPDPLPNLIRSGAPLIGMLYGRD